MNIKKIWRDRGVYAILYREYILGGFVGLVVGLILGLIF